MAVRIDSNGNIFHNNEYKANLFNFDAKKILGVEVSKDAGLIGGEVLVYNFLEEKFDFRDVDDVVNNFSGNAVDVYYNNISSNLDSSDVQSAIDELATAYTEESGNFLKKDGDTATGNYFFQNGLFQVDYVSISGRTITVEDLNDNLILSAGSDAWIEVERDIKPDEANLHDIGSDDLPFKNVYVGDGSLFVNGKVVITDQSSQMNFTTVSNQKLRVQSKGTANLEFLTDSGDAIVNSNSGGEFVVNVPATINNGLVVNGTLTAVNSENLFIEDNIVTLNSNVTGSPNINAGIEVERGSLDNATLIWDEANDYWVAGIGGVNNSRRIILEGDSISDFANDEDYVKQGENVSLLVNDANYVSEGDNISLLVNDESYISDFTGFTTDTLTEGSNNLYYTDQRVDQRVAGQFIGGNGLIQDSPDGTLTWSWDGSTNSLTPSYNPVVTDTRYILKGGDTATGTYNFNSGLFYIDEVLNRVSVGGDSPEWLFTIENAGIAEVGMKNTASNVRIRSGANNSFGFIGTFTDHPFQIYGNGWNNLGFEVLSDGTVHAPNDASFDSNVVVTGNIEMAEGSTVDGVDVSELVSNVGNLTTDDVSEGSSNLYFTTNRVRESLSSDGDLTYDISTGTFDVTTYKSSDFDADFNGKSTDDLSEGNENLYYTDERARNSIDVEGDLQYDPTTGIISLTTYKPSDFDDNFEAKTTNDLSEGSSNLYFTIERAQDAVGNILTNSSNIEFVYDDVNNTITSNLTGFDGFSTDDLNEGSNLYFTDARSISAVEGEPSLDLSGDVTVGGTFIVTGESTFNSNITVNGNINVTGTVDGIDISDLENRTSSVEGDYVPASGGTFSGDLTVDGHFSAQSKSFVIPHPTRKDYELHHGSLEGPEHGVYFRGELMQNNKIKLPDYWEGLVDEKTITVQLTPKRQFARLYVESANMEEIVIGNEDGTTIECYYIVHAERRDIDKLQVEVEKSSSIITW